MSRISTAICARLAASATRVKSRRKASVDGPAVADDGRGGGARFEDDMKDVGDWRVVDCCDDDDDDERGEVMWPFILAVGSS